MEKSRKNNTCRSFLSAGVLLVLALKGGKVFLIEFLDGLFQLRGELVIAFHQLPAFLGQDAAASGTASPNPGHQGVTKFLFHMVEHVPGGGIRYLHHFAGIPDRTGLIHQMQQHGKPCIVQVTALGQGELGHGTGQLLVVGLDQVLLLV